MINPTEVLSRTFIYLFVCLLVGLGVVVVLSSVSSSEGEVHAQRG